MKHRIAVPDGLINPETSPVPKYMTGVAEADTFVDAFAIGRMFAQRYGFAFLLSPDCHHIMTAWRKVDDDEAREIPSRHVITGTFIDSHTGANGLASPCPECIKVEMSVKYVLEGGDRVND